MRALLTAIVLVVIGLPGPVSAQAPYTVVDNWARLPDGRKIGNSSAVELSPDGRSLWLMDRCGGTTCADSSVHPIIQFDLEGNVLRTFGAGMMVMPHGIHVDRQGNVWVTDAQGAAGKGHQVFKFSPEGRVLMTLGRAGVAASSEDTFNRPSDVITDNAGNIYVADGHGGDSNARLLKFTAAGRFIKAWGVKGNGPGQFDLPHALAFDGRGRLWVSDRVNRRLQVFDTEGAFLESHAEFGAFSGIHIDGDRLYGADSTSNAVESPAFRKGVRILRLGAAAVETTIADAMADPMNTAGSEGIAVDRTGNLYVTYTDGRGLVKFQRR